MRSFFQRWTIATIAALASLPLHAATSPHILWYTQPAKDWNEALPIGNGRLGAMVFGDYKSETIQLNEESLWAGSPADGNADASTCLSEIQRLLLDNRIAEAVDLSEHCLAGDPMCIRSYQSFGELKIDFYDHHFIVPSPQAYRRELDIETGVACVDYQLAGGHFHREIWASAPDDLIVLRLTADQPAGLTFRLGYHRAQDATATENGNNELEISGQIIDLPAPSAGEAGLHMRFAGLIRAAHCGGRITATHNNFFVEGADQVTFYITAATDYNFDKLDLDRTIDPLARCRQILDKAGEDYTALKKRHVADHRAFMNRMTFSLGTAEEDLPTDLRLKRMKEGMADLSLVALYFQYGRYLLMNSSRSPGILPANLQGIWCKDMHAPWNSDFHTNINIQMNYWPADLCNLSETMRPFCAYINAMRKPGRTTACKSYNSSGWTINHVSNPFGHTAISDGVGWGTFPVAGGWLALHPWEHYLFTDDLNYLRSEAYPIMKEAAEFLLGYLIEDKQGRLVTAPSNSPENSYRLPDGSEFRLTYAATMDIQIITELFNACITAEKRLGEDSEFGRKLTIALKKLPPVQISNRYNTVQEWIEDYEEVEPGHRHMSHLFGLYPGTTINQRTPELFAAAHRTIDRRRAYNQGELNQQVYTNTGWSQAWMINFYARLLDGNEAWNSVKLLLQKSTLNNLLDNHPPFQIDGNFGGTAGIAEMLLQSHAGEIHLLPALPAAWSHGQITGLRARGGFTVDIRWKDGLLQEAVITADSDKKGDIRYGNQVKSVSLKQGKPFVYRINSQNFKKLL